MEFPGLARNQEVKRQLSLAVAADRLPHAILLEGERSSGKRILAKQLAMAAICTAEPSRRPCGECAHCVKVRADSHPDLFFAEGGTAARSFHVEVIREIRADAYIKPNEAGRKVYLLFGVEAMSPQAQNALLKILEEPPPHVLFVLTCVSATALLPTVRSRVQIFSLEPPEYSDDDESRAVACQAGEIARAVTAGREAELLELTAGLIKDKERFRSVLAYLLLLLRDACVRRGGGTTLLSDQRDSVNSLCQNATRQQLLQLVNVVEDAQHALDRNANMALLVTCLCAGLRRAAGK